MADYPEIEDGVYTETEQSNEQTIEEILSQDDDD
jgi:hypothetical protein